MFSHIFDDSPERSRGVSGSSFDLPEHPGKVHKVPAICLSARPYFHRFTDDAIELVNECGDRFTLRPLATARLSRSS